MEAQDLSGAGMDRAVTPEHSIRKWLVSCGLIVLVIGAVGYLRLRPRGGVRSVDASTLELVTIQRGELADTIRLRGTVLPLESVFLDAIQGGRVEETFVEEGSQLEAGTPLLRLSNTEFELRLLAQEVEITGQLHLLEGTRLTLERDHLVRQRQILELEYQVRRLTQHATDQEALVRQQILSTAAYRATRQELAHNRSLLDAETRGLALDVEIRQRRLDQVNRNLARLETSLRLVRESLHQLVISAPISGQLTLFDAEIGTSINAGQRLGRIDRPQGFKVRAEIDEFYVDRIRTGQGASFVANAISHEIVVRKIYPEVRDGLFRVDLAPADTISETFPRGQTLHLRLRLGAPREALLVSRGAFLEQTAGAWMFVISADGQRAERRNIRLGQASPESFEVLDGLAAGDTVIVSSYRGFEALQYLRLENTEARGTREATGDPS